MPQGRGGYRGGRSGGNRGPQRRSGGGGGGSRGAAVAAPVVERPTGPVELPHAIVVKDLAEKLGVSGIEIIKELMKNGTMATLNVVLDFDTAATVAIDLGFDVSEAADHAIPEAAVEPERPRIVDAPESLKPRPPVVTIMGHVDHGKTSLLDKIRNADVASGEAGGITQHIGAYQVEVNGRKISFIDTPGHEAFTAMRARGAQTTDIAVIVVAADDGVMPQTREAIDHAKAAGVSIVIAINKIDRPNANIDKVKQQLTENDVVIEEYGGDIPAVEVSARTGDGIPELLETLLLVADVGDLKANPDRPAEGTVLEARLDKNRGPVATLLVQRGTLRTTDIIVAGEVWGRVRDMFDDRNNRLEVAPPSTPVGVLGLAQTPTAGQFFEVVADEKSAKTLVETRLQQRQREEFAPTRAVSLDELFQQTASGQARELNVILKTDVQGSIEPLRNQLEVLQGDNVKVRVVAASTGAITENDVNLAVASKGIIIGFNVRPEVGASNLAMANRVDIRFYKVIYDVIDDIQKALVGMQEERFVEVVSGHGEVRQVFRVGRRDVIAGTFIRDGIVTRNSFVRVRRGRELVFDGKIETLKRFKDDVREVNEGYECGISLEDFASFQEGDLLEFYAMEKQSVAVRAS